MDVRGRNKGKGHFPFFGFITLFLEEIYVFDDADWAIVNRVLISLVGQLYHDGLAVDLVLRIPDNSFETLSGDIYHGSI